ncbi:unnamed protein product [Arctia plantaginis]|uniref:Sulfatase N-terminal domain-containing protein n=1 Tax=Arctia plantaginis TaxID=874455 RepID=A0A8S0ZZF7_ARCPL|nr:unnamed protein product [Arctia plantaginis]
MIIQMSAFPQRPSNVVFIMVDDMGWNDVSFHGSDQILTPNIDTLAYQSVILQQYYSEAICTPARTALLTGKYPMRLGMHGQPLFNSEDRGIPLTERLLPSYLKELGYSTHLVGKWHVGMSREEYLPTSRGYDSHYGMRGGYVDYYTYNKVETWPNGRQMFGLDLYDDGVPQDSEQRYIVDALTDKAVKIIHYHNSSRPLFLHVTHNAPHAGNDGGALQPPLYSHVKHNHIANPNRRLYAEIVTHIDRSVGKIVRALADKQILDDTIIIFASDNGAPTVGEFRNWGVNLPFRGKKYTPWEGGVRVPAFIFHSALRPRVWQGLMHITDWLPTLTAAAGGNVPSNLDGVNQWDAIIRDKMSKRSEVLIAVEDSATNAWAAYRAGDYKIVVGNVTGVSNGYYGAEFLVNKKTPPEYYSSLRCCEVATSFEEMGIFLDLKEVRTRRKEATIQQEDTERDPTPCLPSPTRGCLFNVRRDPSEGHDLWARASKIATLLTSRLRGLWAFQQRRGALNLNIQSDPANFNYVWSPWLTQQRANNTIVNLKVKPLDKKKTDKFNLAINFNQRRSGNRNTTVAAVINCDGMGLSHIVYWLLTISITVVSCTVPKPNIVFIMADDLGWNDVSFHGSDQIPTPNIDLLALSGVAFGRYYSHAMCTPSRAAFLTGKYAHKTGMQGYPLVMAEDRGIPVTEKLLPQYLKEAGYATHLVGKWHVGLSRNEFLPTSRGFDSHFGHRGGFMDYYEYTLEENVGPLGTVSGYTLFKNLTPAWDVEGYITDVYTSHAVSVIQQHDVTAPLFLMVSHNAVHSSNDASLLQAPPEDVRKMRHIEMASRRLFAAMLKKLDDGVGEIVKALYNKQMLENTIIAFVSDNGGMTGGQHINYASNYPMRGTKMSPFEGGVRVVGLVWSTSLNNSDHYWDGYMHVADWVPTLLSAAGMEIPSGLDGINLWEVINSNEKSKRTTMYEIDDYTGYASITTGEYKLVMGNIIESFTKYYGSNLQGVIGKVPLYSDTVLDCSVYNILHAIGRPFSMNNLTLRSKSIIKCNSTSASVCLPTNDTACLYNIVKDPCETTNLSEIYPELVQTMKFLLQKEQATRIPRKVPMYRDPLAAPSRANYTWAPWLPDSNVRTVLKEEC